MRQGWKKTTIVVLSGTLILTGVVLVGCGGSATPTPASLVEAYVSRNLPTDYEGALPAATQLVLGIFLLEGTPNAVTPEQAQTLLPLWKSLQSGAVQGAAEVNAVLSQIERTMTADQLQAIAAMRLTQEDLSTWARERGMGWGPGPGGPVGTPGVERPGWTPGPGGPGEFSPERRETMRAGWDAMTEEQRAQWMATAQAGGMPAGRWGERGRAATGQFRFLLPSLIDLLTQRAGS